MDMSEPLCDLRFVKAEYQSGKPADRLSESCFQVSILPLGDAPRSFSVAEKNGEQFAAELDVLAAHIRARVMRARLHGEEMN